MEDRGLVEAVKEDKELGEAAKEDKELGEAVKGMVLKDGNDEVLIYAAHRLLDQARQQVMATAFPECELQNKVVAIVAAAADGTKRELVAIVPKAGLASSPQLVMGSCQITYDDLSPSECVEYAFAESPDVWSMAKLSLDALETYRDMKFEAWKHMLLSPTCEAQFRRMLQIGIVSQLYDPHVFPTPESMKSKYQVTDDRTGKIIELPHPVSALRVWDAQQLAYKAVDTELKGAPPEAEKDSWWADFISELSEKHGHEYIARLKTGK